MTIPISQQLRGPWEEIGSAEFIPFINATRPDLSRSEIVPNVAFSDSFVETKLLN